MARFWPYRFKLRRHYCWLMLQRYEWRAARRAWYGRMLWEELKGGCSDG